jgi:ubiquinone/menaquinone biosynthesis C-methylase UbiE
MMLVDPMSILEWDKVERHDLLSNIASFDLAKLRAGDEAGIDPQRFTYLQNSAESISLPDGVADVVYSNAFLEHVPDMDAVARELARITRPGGLNIHGIDGKDHRHYADANIPPLKFLEISSNEPIVEICNRIRPLAIPAVFERHGFTVVEQEVFERIDVTDEMRMQFAEPYRSMPQDHLEVLSGLIVFRRM